MEACNSIEPTETVLVTRIIQLCISYRLQHSAPSVALFVAKHHWRKTVCHLQRERSVERKVINDPPGLAVSVCLVVT